MNGCWPFIFRYASICLNFSSKFVLIEQKFFAVVGNVWLFAVAKLLNIVERRKSSVSIKCCNCKNMLKRQSAVRVYIKRTIFALR